MMHIKFLMVGFDFLFNRSIILSTCLLGKLHVNAFGNWRCHIRYGTDFNMPLLVIGEIG